MFWRRSCAVNRLRRKDTGDTIVVGLLHHESGLELLSWTIHALARPGDLILALIVSVPFSTFLVVDRRQRKNGQSEEQQGKLPQLGLGELRQLCANKQIRMEVKFRVGEDAEEIVRKQACAIQASILVVSSAAKLSWRFSRRRGCYGLTSSKPECVVVVVEDGKVLTIKEKRSFKILSLMNIACLSEGMQRECNNDEKENASSIWRLPSRNRKGKSKSWAEPKTERSPRAVLDGSAFLCADTDSSSSIGGPSHQQWRKPLLSSERDLDSGNRVSRWKGFARLWKRSTLRYLILLRSRVISRNLITNWPSWKSDLLETDYLLEENSETDSPPLATGTIWKCFTLKELESATNNFAQENFLGKGGYAEVYKGTFPEEGPLAVKRLTRGRTEDQRVNDFLTELGIIVHIDHPNTARLVGFCVEGGLHLVFGFSPCGSLASMLHGPKSQLLDWNVRYKVALGMARGLHYLHEGCQRRIIHRDIKASNILLGENFEPQISDFGLAKWLPDQWSHLMITEIEGTFGYLAPEYFMYGIVDEKTDVFSYGVVLLELIAGRLPIDSLQQSLVMWAKPLLECGNVHTLVDPRLRDAYDLHELEVMARTAYLCVQRDAALRPTMRKVVDILNGQSENIHCWDTCVIPERHPGHRPEFFDNLQLQYETDINRHRKIALDF